LSTTAFKPIIQVEHTRQHTFFMIRSSIGSIFMPFKDLTAFISIKSQPFIQAC
jgi:hypothetical protein